MEMCYNYYKIMKPGDTMLTSDEVLNLNYYKKALLSSRTAEPGKSQIFN